jgi:hypothetical protein
MATLKGLSISTRIIEVGAGVTVDIIDLIGILDGGDSSTMCVQKPTLGPISNGLGCVVLLSALDSDVCGIAVTILTHKPTHLELLCPRIAWCVI